MGRIVKTASIILTLLLVLILGCENPVQGYIRNNLFGPKYNLEVKKFAQTNAIDYGFSVDIYGDYIIVGAPADHGNTTNEESVYIYHRTGPDKWEGPFKLPKPAGYTIGDRFGYSVSIYSSSYGDFAAIGAPDTAVNGNPNAGAVYIYRRKTGVSNEWEEIKKLTKADQNPLLYPVTGNEQFGKSIKLYDKWLLIGAPYDGLNGPESDYGEVYRFKYNGSDWEYDYIFSRNTTLANANFGTAIDVNSSYAVIGAPGEDIDGKSNVGSVYIYSFNNDKFEFKERITNLERYTGDDDYFGGKLSISGNFLAVGSPGAIVNNTFIAGTVYVFMLQNGTWNNTPFQLTLEEPAEYDFFGFPVALKQIDDTNYILMAGSFTRDNNSVADAGAVYIYTNTVTSDISGVDTSDSNTQVSNDPTNKWVLQKELRASDFSENSYFGNSIALSNNYAVIGACTPRDDTVYENGRVYIFR